MKEKIAIVLLLLSILVLSAGCVRQPKISEESSKLVLSTDKDVYKLGDVVTINLNVVGERHFTKSSASGYQFFKLENGEWTKLRITHSIESTEGRAEYCYECVDGKLQFKCEIAGAPVPGYFRLISSSSTWDQKSLRTEERMCDNTTYVIGFREQVLPGNYKVRLDYVISNVENEHFEDSSLIEEEGFAEAEFEIVTP